MEKLEELKMDYDAKTLKSFKTYGVGLLTPQGELVPTMLYGHFEELKKYSEFEKEIEQYEEQVTSYRYEFESTIEPGEHPCWHVFECNTYEWQNRLETTIMQKAYDAGWARIGMVHKRPKPHLVELETSGKNIKKLEKCAREIAELLDSELLITNVDKFSTS